MVLDSNFTVLKEIELTGGFFYLDGAFVLKDGLYLSAPFKENKLQFQLLKFKK